MRVAVIVALLLAFTGVGECKRHAAGQLDKKWKCSAISVDAKTGQVTEWHCTGNNGKHYIVKPQ